MAEGELPKVTMLGVGHGVVPGGEKQFDMLVWQSRIPPYASYIVTCDMERAAQVEVGKKQLLNKRRREQWICGSREDKVDGTLAEDNGGVEDAEGRWGRKFYAARGAWCHTAR
ncbi:unnamed protein product [Urochloa humidicola]